MTEPRPCHNVQTLPTGSSAPCQRPIGAVLIWEGGHRVPLCRECAESAAAEFNAHPELVGRCRVEPPTGREMFGDWLPELAVMALDAAPPAE